MNKRKAILEFVKFGLRHPILLYRYLKIDSKRNYYGRFMVANTLDNLGHSHSSLKKRCDYYEAKLKKLDSHPKITEFNEKLEIMFGNS